MGGGIGCRPRSSLSGIAGLREAKGDYGRFVAPVTLCHAPAMIDSQEQDGKHPLNDHSACCGATVTIDPDFYGRYWNECHQCGKTCRLQETRGVANTGPRKTPAAARPSSPRSSSPP